jgi:hypothetical protein
MSELSFSGHSIMGALSWTEWEVASSNRLEDTERKIKQPEGKPKPLVDGFSSHSAITIPYYSVGRGKYAIANPQTQFIRWCQCLQRPSYTYTEQPAAAAVAAELSSKTKVAQRKIAPPHKTEIT